MAERMPPAYLQARTDHDAETFRRATAAWALPTTHSTRGGVLVPPSSGDPNQRMQVTPTSPASMAVVVAPGEALVDGSVSPANQGLYTIYNDAPKTVTVPASSSSYARIDVVYAVVNDAAYSGSTSDWQLVVIQGQPNDFPAPVDVPDNFLGLAAILVRQSATTVLSGDIFISEAAPVVARGGILPVKSTYDIPITPSYGQAILHTGTRQIEVWDKVTGAWTSTAPFIDFRSSYVENSSFSGIQSFYAAGLGADLNYPFAMNVMVTGDVMFGDANSSYNYDLYIDSPEGTGIWQPPGIYGATTVTLNGANQWVSFAKRGYRQYPSGGNPQYWLRHSYNAPNRVFNRVHAEMIITPLPRAWGS